MLVFSVALFAVGSLLCANALDLSSLIALRFITGLGLGAAMPNAVTLMSEFSPDRHKSIITNAMFTGFPIGAAAGGFVAAWIIPQWGWRGVMLLGGFLPLALLPALVFVMPESMRFMVQKRINAQKVVDVLGKIAPNLPITAQSFLHESNATTGNEVGLAVILSAQYRTRTALLWVAYFMGLLIFFALINWMPVLFKGTGMDSRRATLISALFPLGGIGAIFFGWLMDRFNANALIATGYFLTAMAVYVIGVAVDNTFSLIIAVFMAGALMNTSQCSMPALASRLYLTSGRATGISWMLGIGCFGGIAGSYLVAQLTIWQFGVSQIFAIIAIPAVIPSIALILKNIIDRRAAGFNRGCAG